MAQLTRTYPSPTAAPGDRLAHISRARRAVLYGEAGPDADPPPVADWIAQSWRRCLAQGHRPEQPPSFELIQPASLRLTLDASRHLLEAARPVLDKLGSAIAGTRYFALLTNHDGVVIDSAGPIDRQDRRADQISRPGTDLSERHVGTTAIGTALAALEPVWLHRGEHFFESSEVYSCAGAPLFGPNGQCIGMLDLTGIEASERPELRHLVAQSARSIENAMTLRRPHALLLRLNWPGRALGDDGDGLVCADAEGYITGANQTARQLLPQLAALAGTTLHCGDLFALPFAQFFDAARRQGGLPAAPMDVPLWSGLRLHAQALLAGQRGARSPIGFTGMDGAAKTARPLRDLETALIRKAVDDARGNVLQAARALGVSRATVYRRLSPAARR